MTKFPRVWVDTDIALGAPSGDVDDGFALAALLAAAAAGRIELLGISTVFGNTTAARAEEQARRLCGLAGVSVPVVRGSARPGSDSPASERIAALPDGTELLCLGPLTNAAASLARDPRTAGRVSLRAVGGNLSSRGVLAPLWPFEFNLSLDRRAAIRTLSAPWRKLRLYPLDVAGRVRADAARLERLSGLGPLGAELARGSRRWLARARWRHLSRSFPVFDLVPALDLTGVLPVVEERRKPPRALRRFFGNPMPLRFVVSLDPTMAWEAFEALIGRVRPLAYNPGQSTSD